MSTSPLTAAANRLPRIAITPGEPAGIGPDLLVQLAQAPQRSEWVAIADPDLLADRARRLSLPLQLSPFVAGREQCSGEGRLSIIASPLARLPQPGRGCADNARAILDTLDIAVQHCREDLLDALVTGPINKHLIGRGLEKIGGDATFSGHTEYLAARCQSERVVMMLSCERIAATGRPLRVALATTHLPLREVADAIQRDSLEQTLRILHHDLQEKFAITKPRILVCGLNPHAGEQGALGNEEQTIITPCLDQLRSEGMDLSPALPADTAFTDKLLADAHAVLAMYHDQGLPVLKSHGFGRAINITLGLPIVRTSVDHGTAFDLAGSGRADSGSLRAAIDAAITISRAAKKRRAAQ